MEVKGMPVAIINTVKPSKIPWITIVVQTRLGQKIHRSLLKALEIVGVSIGHSYLVINSHLAPGGGKKKGTSHLSLVRKLGHRKEISPPQTMVT